MNKSRSFPADELIPQKPPMRLLDEYFDVAPPKALGRTCFTPECIFTAADGFVSPAALVETLAQTAAASAFLELNRAVPDDPPQAPGYLVGLRDFVFAREGARAGDVLDTHLQETHHLGPARLYEGSVLLDGREIASGGLKTWQPEEGTGAVESTWPGAPHGAVKPVNDITDLVAKGCVSDMLSNHMQVFSSAASESPEARLYLDPGLPPFSGHFTGNPILPGVCLIEAALLLAGVCAPDARRLVRIENARFTRLTRPGETLVLKAAIRPQSSHPPALMLLRVDIHAETPDGTNPPVATLTLGLDES